MRKMKETIKKILKMCIFISLVNLPFITSAQILSVDTFFDSFEKPEFYICFENKNNQIQSATQQGDYIIIQKATHPDFTVNKNDNIIYARVGGELVCSRVHHTIQIGSIKKYYTVDENNQISKNPVYDVQIAGKIVKTVNGNIWNSISIKVWDLSIHELNINALMSN